MTVSFHKFGEYFPGTGDVKDLGVGKGKNYAVRSLGYVWPHLPSWFVRFWSRECCACWLCSVACALLRSGFRWFDLGRPLVAFVLPLLCLLWWLTLSLVLTFHRSTSRSATASTTRTLRSFSSRCVGLYPDLGCPALDFFRGVVPPHYTLPIAVALIAVCSVRAAARVAPSATLLALLSVLRRPVPPWLPVR